MTAVRPIAAIVFRLALVAWIAAMIAPAVAAMVAFPRLAEFGVVLPGSEAYFVDDAAAAGRFVAGYVTNPIFVASDRVRLIAAVAAWGAILVTGARPDGRGRAAIVATLAVGLASIVLAWSLAMVAPPLAAELEAWRVAVLADVPDAATQAKAAFDPLHEQASTLMKAELLLVLAAVVAGGLASASTAPQSEPETAPR